MEPCQRSINLWMAHTARLFAVVAMRTPDARGRPSAGSLAPASSTGRGRARAIAGSEWGGRVRSARPHAAGVSRAGIVPRDGVYRGAARSRLLTVMRAQRVARDGGSHLSGTRSTASRPRTPRMVDATAATPPQVRTSTPWRTPPVVCASAAHPNSQPYPGFSSSHAQVTQSNRRRHARTP